MSIEEALRALMEPNRSPSQGPIEFNDAVHRGPETSLQEAFRQWIEYERNHPQATLEPAILRPLGQPSPTTASQAAPLNVMRATPQAVAPPAAIAPSVAAPQGKTGGFDWRALLKLAGPAAGMFAGNPAAQAAFSNRWRELEAHDQGEQQRQRQTDEQKRLTGSRYALDVFDRLGGLEDPAQWAQLQDLAAGHAPDPQTADEIRRLSFPEERKQRARLKEISDEVQKLRSNGLDPNDLADQGHVIRLKDGTVIPMAAALQLTSSVFDKSGKPVPTPKKPETRSLQVQAAEALQRGDTASYDRILKAIKETGQADDRPPDPSLQAIRDLDKRLKEQRLTQGVGGGSGDGGAQALTDEGLDYAATEYRVTGRMPALGQRSNQDRAAIINRAAKHAKELGLTPAASIQKQSAYKSDGSALTRMRTMSSAAEAFETKALQQSDIIDQLSLKVPRSQWPAINSAILAGKVNLLGDSNAQQLANAVQTFAAEYAKIIEGSTGSAAGSTDSSRRAADRLINPAMNKGTMRDVLNLMRREMRLTVQGYDATIAHITERMGGVPTTPPAAEKGPQRTYYDMHGKPVQKPK